MITDRELAEALERVFCECPEAWDKSFVKVARKARELLCPVLQPKEHWRKVRVGQVWQWADIECDTVVRIGKDPASYYKATMALGGAILLQASDGTPEYPQWTLVYDPNEEDA